MTATLTTPEQIARYQLAAMRAAVKLEAVGMKHSSGRSVTAQAKRMLGLKRSAKHAEVIEALTAAMNNA